MSIQQNQIVQPTYNGQDIYYRTPVDAIITDGMSLDDYIRNTTGVVESGENSNGRYIKFADGTMICQGSKTFTSVACTTAYGGLYRSNAGNQMNDFPVEFYDIPIVNFGVTNGSASGYNSNTGPIVIVFMKTNTDTTNVFVPTKTNPGRVSIAVGASQTIPTITISYTAIGRWKDYDVSVLPDAQQSTIINSASTNYYDDERVVGIWRDGKPLYRKVYVVTSTSTITTGISWDIIIDARMMSRQSNGQWRNVPWLFNSTDTSWMGGFYLQDSDHTIRFQLGPNLNSINYAHIILLYTKTTDSPITSQTKDLLTVVNGKNITDLETIIQQRIDQLLENKLKERKVATAFISGNISYSANSKIAFDQLKTSTDKLTLSSGGIRIGKGITQILVSAQAFASPTNNTTGYFWTAIKQNSTAVSISTDNPSSWFTTNNHSPVLLNVTEGDIIYLYDVGSTSTGNIRGGANTYLTIEVIKEQG